MDADPHKEGNGEKDKKTRTRIEDLKYPTSLRMSLTASLKSPSREEEEDKEIPNCTFQMERLESRKFARWEGGEMDCGRDHGHGPGHARARSAHPSSHHPRRKILGTSSKLQTLIDELNAKSNTSAPSLPIRSHLSSSPSEPSSLPPCTGRVGGREGESSCTLEDCLSCSSLRKEITAMNFVITTLVSDRDFLRGKMTELNDHLGDMETKLQLLEKLRDSATALPTGPNVHQEQSRRRRSNAASAPQNVSHPHNCDHANSTPTHSSSVSSATAGRKSDHHKGAATGSPHPQDLAAINRHLRAHLTQLRDLFRECEEFHGRTATMDVYDDLFATSLATLTSSTSSTASDSMVDLSCSGNPSEVSTATISTLQDKDHECSPLEDKFQHWLKS